MATSRVRRVLYADCPSCRWTKAVLVYENRRTWCFLCPHCQHVWDTTETAHQEHARLQQRTTELREEHELLKKKRFNHAEHAEHNARLRKHLEDLQAQRCRN
jgi:ssDNA-binding Zn-finger/Zn-ribbon topoisomerase 1